MGTRYEGIIDLTGAAALAPGEDRTVQNPILRVPDYIVCELVSGDERLLVPDADIGASTIRVINPSDTETNESVMLVVFRHSIPR